MPKRRWTDRYDGPLHRRIVASLVIVIDACEEVVEPAGCARGAGWQREARVDWFARIPDSASEGCAGVGDDANAPARSFTGCGREICVAQTREPRPLVRREHAERAPRLREDFIALEDHLIFAGVRLDPAIEQRALHSAVALQRDGLVVAIGVHSLHLQALCQRRNFIACTAVQYHSAPPRPRSVSLSSAMHALDELDAPIAPIARTDRGSPCRTRMRSRRRGFERARATAPRDRERADRAETTPAHARRLDWRRSLHAQPRPFSSPADRLACGERARSSPCSSCACTSRRDPGTVAGFAVSEIEVPQPLETPIQAELRQLRPVHR